MKGLELTSLLECLLQAVPAPSRGDSIRSADTASVTSGATSIVPAAVAPAAHAQPGSEAVEASQASVGIEACSTDLPEASPSFTYLDSGSFGVVSPIQ